LSEGPQFPPFLFAPRPELTFFVDFCEVEYFGDLQEILVSSSGEVVLTATRMTALLDYLRLILNPSPLSGMSLDEVIQSPDTSDNQKSCRDVIRARIIDYFVDQNQTSQDIDRTQTFDSEEFRSLPESQQANVITILVWVWYYQRLVDANLV